MTTTSASRLCRLGRRAFMRAGTAAVALAAGLALGNAALAADKVKVGVFPVSSALPYFVGLERGYFKEQGIDAEMVKLMGAPPIVQGMLTGDLDAGANLVTVDGMNADTKKDGLVYYMSLYGQNKFAQMEQFVAKTGLDAKSVKDFKGKPLKIMSAPGAGNMAMARAVLGAVGMKEGSDYTLTELAMNLHVDAMKAGTFDAGYTLEPNATVMNKTGAAHTVEAGVVSKYIIGRENAYAFMAGGAITGKFMKERPDVARRFAAAWRKALKDIEQDPTTRELLKGNTFTPPELAMTIPLPRMLMIDQLSAQDRKDFQKVIDFTTESGVLKQKVDTAKYLVVLDKKAAS
jgi:NitT/TauT family transport system substrate-binding protein